MSNKYLLTSWGTCGTLLKRCVVGSWTNESEAQERKDCRLNMKIWVVSLLRVVEAELSMKSCRAKEAQEHNWESLHFRCEHIRIGARARDSRKQEKGEAEESWGGVAMMLKLSEKPVFCRFYFLKKFLKNYILKGLQNTGPNLSSGSTDKITPK